MHKIQAAIQQATIRAPTTEEMIIKVNSQAGRDVGLGEGVIESEEEKEGVEVEDGGREVEGVEDGENLVVRVTEGERD